MIDWLKKRLTPRKRQEERWTTLAENIQTAWEEYFDPQLERLENLRSYFRAHEDDLARKLREMGDWFAADMPRTADKPIAVAWRRLELEYKDLELILSSVFRRHYADLPVTWFPLFAPIDEVYGTQFKAAEGPWPVRKNIPPDGWFLTSRGMLGTDYGHLLSIGLNKETYIQKAMPLLLRTKPLHIVLDGLLWYIRFDTPFEHIFKCLWERENHGYELQFSVLGSRFDFTPADITFLDLQTALCTWERESPFDTVAVFPENHIYWHLDKYLPDGFSPSWLPLDIIIAGNEADGKNPLALVAVVRSENPVISAPLATGEISKTEIDKFLLAKFKTVFIGPPVIDDYYEITAFPDFGPVWHLDKHLPSGFPEAWLPLDTIIAGNEADAKNPCALVAIVREGIHLIPTPIEVFLKNERLVWPGVDFEATIDRSAIIEKQMPISLELRPSKLDLSPNFDDVPADFAPLDMPVGGYAYA